MGGYCRGVLAFAFLLLLALPSAHAVAIGVNRASVEFEDVLRGGYAQTVITVTTDSEETISAEVILDGPESSWLNVTKRFNFSRDMPYELVVIAQPPIDAQVKDYVINMSVITGAFARSEGGLLGTSTRASFRVPVTIMMTGTERVACTVGGVTVSDAEEGRPLDVGLSIINRGNVRINPGITLEVFDQLRAKSYGNRSADFGSSILPTVTADAVRSVAFDLDKGQYWVSVRVPECGYAGVYTFDVLEPGAIKDEGEFLRIDVEPWAETGDIIPITAVFRNKGARAVRANFKGTIASVETGEIVKVIDSEQYLVDPDMTAEIKTFFNPTVGGQYRVSGRIYYNSKLTPERETLVNVNGAPVGGRSYSAYALIVIVIAVLVLLIMIRRKRARQHI